MLFLILTHRYMRAFIRENIGCHEDGVGVEAQGSIFPVLARLFLELGHAVQPTERRMSAQNPGQLRMR